ADEDVVGREREIESEVRAQGAMDLVADLAPQIDRDGPEVEADVPAEAEVEGLGADRELSVDRDAIREVFLIERLHPGERRGVPEVSAESRLTGGGVRDDRLEAVVGAVEAEAEPFARLRAVVDEDLI